MFGFGVEPQSTFVTPKYIVSTGEGRVRNTAIAADDAGHLWVVWTRDAIDGLTVSASRWDVQTGKFTTPTTVAAPPHAVDSYTIDAVALGNAVEVLGNFGPTPSGGMGALWHTLLSPTPTVAAPRITVAEGKKTTLRLRVTLAGKPLAGATVTTTGATASAVHRHTVSARTNRQGIARLRLGPFHRSITIRLLIRKTGYANITTKIRVHVRHHK
jgi:hypothetical protein